MTARPQHGDKVMITTGKYKGTVGTYDKDKGVYTEGAGWTGNVHPGRNIETVAPNTADVNVENGRTVRARPQSAAYREWQQLYSTPEGPTDEQVQAYNRKWKSEAEVGIQNRGLGRLLFGKRDDRFLWKRRA